MKGTYAENIEKKKMKYINIKKKLLGLGHLFSFFHFPLPFVFKDSVQLDRISYH